MTHADPVVWSLCLVGVDRSDASSALRNTRWEETWRDNACLLDDSDPDSGLQVTLYLDNLDDLMLVGSLYNRLRPSCGASLYVRGEFATVNGTASLCTNLSGFAHMDMTLHRRPASVTLPAMQHLADAEHALGELRNLLAVDGSV